MGLRKMEVPNKGKKTFPLEYAGQKQQFARAVSAGDFIFLSGCIFVQAEHVG
jgi:hypothetical protein